MVVLALSGLLAGCAPADYVGTPAQRVRTWVSSTQMGQAVGTILGDAARVDEAIKAHRGVTVVHTDCAVLLDDTEAANDNLPSPDGRLTDLLSDAYGVEGSAANDCYDSGGTDAELIAKSEREQAVARRGLLRALARVTQLTGRAVATTTTTQPGGGGIFG
ncbi:MAG TPA: hypothetical protein VGL60_12905 [Acidimicrobiales bacterium]